MKIEGPDVDIEGPEGGFKMPKMKMPSFGFKGPKIEGPEVDLDLPNSGHSTFKHLMLTSKDQKSMSKALMAKLKGPNSKCPPSQDHTFPCLI